MKEELSGKVITNFGLKAKTYSHLKDNNDEDKKPKRTTKKCFLKGRLKFQEFKNRLEAAQTENKLNYVEKNKIDTDSLKEFLKNDKVIPKTQQIFKTKRYNVFTEEINKVALSSSDDK